MNRPVVGEQLVNNMFNSDQHGNVDLQLVQIETSYELTQIIITCCSINILQLLQSLYFVIVHFVSCSKFYRLTEMLLCNDMLDCKDCRELLQIVKC